MKCCSRNQFSKSNNREQGDVLDFEYFMLHKFDNDSDNFSERKIKAMLNIMRKVVDEELSEKQRECVIMVKFQGLKQNEVASVLGLNPSTVCRHLKGAQKKFDNALRYFDCVKAVASL